MKHSIAYLFISLFLIGCSQKEDDSSTETVEVVPLSVTELTGKSTSNTKTLLSWKDNAVNETGFKIERKAGADNYVQVAMVGSDITSYTDSGLVLSTAYTYRIMAYNAVGNAAAYSNEAMVIVYPSVKIGTLNWMWRNLDIDRYRNGDPIPQVTDPNEWANLTTGAWCYYKNSTANGTVYGKLYNWYAVNDPRGLAPLGWHVATDSEWDLLTSFLGGESTAGGALKATEHWTIPNTGATNSSGFTAFAGGARLSDGTFNYIGTLGLWWTADNDNGDVSFYRVLYNNSTKSEGYHNYNSYGLAVRCVRD